MSPIGVVSANDFKMPILHSDNGYVSADRTDCTAELMRGHHFHAVHF